LDYKLYDFISEQAINIGGCDSTCVDLCTADPTTVTIHELPDCLESCVCEGGVISLTEGNVDEAVVSLYALGDRTALEYYSRYFTK